MKKPITIAALALLMASLCSAQTRTRIVLDQITGLVGATDPARCTPGITPNFFNTTALATKYCSATDTWTAAAGGTGTTITGSPLTNQFSVFTSATSVTGTSLLSLLNKGILGQVAEANAGGGYTDLTRILFKTWSSGRLSPPNFYATEVGIRHISETFSGQNDEDNSSKKTLVGFDQTSYMHGSGQRIGIHSQSISGGAGDSFAIEGDNDCFNLIDAPGDEGCEGLRLWVKQPVGQSATITSTVTGGGNTTTTVPIVRSGNPSVGATPQTVNVVSTTGFTLNEWVIIDQQSTVTRPRTDEAVKIAAISPGTPGTLTFTPIRSHASGVTVLPATVIMVDNQFGLGEDRYMISKSATGVTAGTLADPIADTTFVGTGTSWSNTMLTGGSSANPGCISVDSDTQGGLTSWWPISTINAAAQTMVFKRFSGNGHVIIIPGGSTYQIRPCAKVMTLDADFTVTPPLITGVVLEHTGFSWPNGGTVEEAVSPEASVNGISLQINPISPSTNSAFGMQIINSGYAPIATGLYLTGFNMSYPHFGYGIFMNGNVKYAGLQIDSAVSTGKAISLHTYSGDNKLIQWTNIGAFGNVSLMPDFTNGNFGMSYGNDLSTYAFLARKSDGAFLVPSNLVVGGAGGTNTVVRCLTAGALPIGALTITAASCGSTSDTGLRIP